MRDFVDRPFQIFMLQPLRLAGYLLLLVLSLLTWTPAAAAADASNCVVKLKFSSDDRSDSATNTFAKQILGDEGYKVIDDWLFTIWSHSDYEVKIIINHTDVPNYGFPVSLMGMQLFIADGKGTVLVNNYIDRSNLEASLRAFVPACNTSAPASNADANQEVNAQ
jgi:hypothetical protein